MELALDHLTVTDTTPWELVEVAARTGYQAVCMFLEPMAVLPRMPAFELIGDRAAQRETRARLDALGIGIDLAYPFTLAGRTDVAAFRPALETAAFLGARMANALVYDRDPARRQDRLAEFCELADGFRLGVALEFYPSSQVRSLNEAVELVQRVGAPGRVGVNVDLLHLVRSGGAASDLARAPAGAVIYGQFCDGPETCDPADREYEASSQRRLPGEGCFDIEAFAAALPAGARVSIEAPLDAAIAAGAPPELRARRALDALRTQLTRTP